MAVLSTRTRSTPKHLPLILTLACISWGVLWLLAVVASLIAGRLI